MKKMIRFYLFVFAAILIALVFIQRSDKKDSRADNDTPELNEQVSIGMSETEAHQVQQTERTHTLAETANASQSTAQAEVEAADAVSSPNWRPAAVFADVMRSLPQRQYPRGDNNTRRYHEPASRSLAPTEADAPPLPLAASPADGRFHLYDQEIDDHTLRAGRLVFNTAALDPIVSGQRSRLLAPTLTEEVLTLVFESVKTRSAHTHTLQGYVAGEEETSTAQIVYHDGVIHGNVIRHVTQQELEYRTLADGHMMVRELDHSTMTDNCGTCSDDIMADIMEDGYIENKAAYVITDSGEITPKDTTGWRTVDIVVGYGMEARIADGGYAQIEARIIDAVDRVTTAFTNSGIADAELMLLGTIEDPDYRFSDTSASDMELEISALRTTNGSDGGALDTVTDFSVQLGADFTSFIIKEGRGSTAGVQSADKYTIVSRTSMTIGSLTFAHEIGHCLGCGHAWGDSSTAVDSARYAWRYTAPDDGKAYQTIVSYNNGIGGIKILYYSNPNIAFMGAPTGAFPGYDLSTDPNATGDPIFIEKSGIRGFDGSNTNLGANNAGIIDNGNPAAADSGLAHNSSLATRTNFEVINPVAAARWERGTTETIKFNGGDMEDLATIELYKGGVLHTTFATDVNPATHRNFEWTIPFSQTEGTDYMIRVELLRNGSTLFADSGIFEIFSDLPHVKAQSTPTIPEGVGVVSQLELSFNVPMNPATFSVGSDIVSFTDPDGTSVLSSITGTTWSASNTVLTIDFTPFSVSGTYQLVLGPDIEDTVGIKMDQDLDGTAGESLDDRYTANFFVNPPLIHYANMDTDPGWTFSSNNPAYGWEWGQPTGGTGPSDGSSYNTVYGIPDPTSGYNGPNVIGYNLDGDYERGITSTRWATTPALDCSSYKNVSLRFQRWLGVYDGSTSFGGDYAYIEVSNDGTNWTQVWKNTNKLDEARWVEVEYDISAVADGQPTVYVRWGMGKTNTSLNDDSCGWNIDEVIVFGDVLDGILLYSPNGGESYYAGSTVDLSWASVLGGNVQIELLKNGLVDSSISASTANDGSFAWPIPVGLTAGADYRIRITSLDDPTKIAESTANFSILSIVVTSPIGGESYYAGSTANLAWVSSMGGNVKIELLKNGSVDSTISSSTTNDNAYGWQIPVGQAPGSDYRIRITSLDDPSKIAESAADFTIISILLTSPNGGESYNVGATVDLTWVSSMGGNVQIELLKNGLVDSTITSSTTNDGSHAWQIPFSQAPGLNYRIRITSLVDPSKTVESAADFAINALPSVPYSESFISGLGDWAQDSADDIEWTWRTGGTPTGGTGPSAAHGGAGDYYLYMESSGAGNPGKLARISCWFDLRAVTQADFSFYYHMYGATMGTLLVEASADGLVWTELFTMSGDQGNSWIQAIVSLNDFAGDYAKIRISGTTGSSFTSDIAVDSFTITGSGDPTPTTLNYNGNGNSGGNVPVDASSPYDPGATVTVLGNTNGLVKTGHTFASWNTQADGNGTSYAPAETFTINANTTLYAQWAPIVYTVTFQPGAHGSLAGGTPNVVHMVAYGSAAPTPPAVTPDAEYDFTGWDPPVPETITGDFTTTAQYALKTYTVAFQTDGTVGASLTGNTNQVVNHGANGTAVTANVPSGYQLVNWTVTDVPYSIEATVTPSNVIENMTLVANFVANDALVVTAASTEKVYDGTALTTNGYSITSGTLDAEHTLVSVTVTGSQTLAGASPNVPSNALIRDGSSNDVTDSYAITYANGTLAVTAKDVSVLSIAELTPVTYDGTAQTPEPVVNDGATLLTNATDYTLSYAANTNAGTATVTVSGIGNYTGTQDKPFTITQATPTVSAWPMASSIILGQTLSASTLSNGTASVDGSFAFTNPNTEPAEGGTNVASVTFTPTDTTNYTTVTGSVDVWVDASVVLPFSEDFEALVLGDLNGQNSWLASGAVVQTNLVYEGSQAAEIAGEGYVLREFVDAQTNVWTDFRFQPAFLDGEPSNLDADSTSVFYFNTNGHPVVYDGLTPVVVSNVTVTAGEWVRVTVNSDYAAKTWSLHINGALEKSDLAFYDATATHYTEFSVKGAGTATVPVDAIQIDLVSPFAGLPLLTVYSAHGAPSPAVGTASYAVDSSITAYMDVTTITNDQIQYVCTGWTGTGNAPASGSGTNISFVINQDSSITWQWQTNYWVTLEVVGE